MKLRAYQTTDFILNKALKCLIVFFTLFLISSNSFSTSLADCKDIATTPDPGVNCLYFGLPLCTSTLTDHRVNCADLSDLPLCSQIDDYDSTLPGKNCVKECLDPAFSNPDPLASPPLIRGTDFAIHNRDCVRFCDALESGITANPGVNCKGRLCHQLPDGTDPVPGTNCNLSPCNLLTPDELNEVKMDDDTKKYCEGDNVKCFEFTQAQLPFVKYRSNNSMCEIHNCQSSNLCQPDEISIINSKGESYIDNYKTYITAGYDITSDSMCNLILCKPIAKRAYRCEPMEDETPITRNINCDETGDGATCNSGYCYKTINCNEETNASAIECASTPSEDSTSIGTTIDDINSWFYRPVPLEKATIGSGVLRNMQPELCYSKGQMESYDWGWESSLGLFHSYLLPDKTRSPGKCGANNDGSRGSGYIYLCGNSGNLYSSLSQDVAYHRGYVETTYTEGEGVHKIVSCLRYKNAMRPDDGISETCGKRECGISCFFGECASQVCGYDVCKTLIVKDSEPKKCEMNDDLFNSDLFKSFQQSKECLARAGDDPSADSDIRIRAVKYGNKICTFLDTRGQFAYSQKYAKGTEQLSSGECVSGEKDSNGVCNGQNTNKNQGLIERWRTHKFNTSGGQIPYIGNNRPEGQAPGYIDLNGRFFKQQECIKAPLRIDPPVLNSIANSTNASLMFIPPVYILNARTKRGGPISNSETAETLGTTDFNYPELTVKFGITEKKLSLGIGYIGTEIESPDPLSFSTITTTVLGQEFSIEVMLKKEYNNADSTPLACLYRKVKDHHGAYLSPVRIGCVKRNLPEIDNSKERILNPFIDPKKIIVKLDPTSTYDSSRIQLKYLGNFGTNGVDDNCTGDDDCSNFLTLENENIAISSCSKDLENHEICVQREECSKLNIECINNEINLHEAVINQESTSSFLAIRDQCTRYLLPACNSKKGIINTHPSSSIINQNPLGEIGNDKAYGWYNEICVVKGFESKLKNIISHKIPSNVKGKCLIDVTSPYLTDSDPSTNCDDGGKAPNCLCLQSYEDTEIDESSEVIRKETPREAGLCVDMPLPEVCEAIDYNISQNTTNPDDLEYIEHSLNKNSYNNSTGVHFSHLYRSEGKDSPNEILLRGHAEFPATILGVNNVRGQCKGFWKYKTTASGIIIPPKLSCLNDSGNAKWSEITTDQCQRYSCPEIFTTGPNSSGDYQGDYGDGETLENKGFSHGFALWEKFTKTNDFQETTSANKCIAGFKAIGSSYKTASGNVSGDAKKQAALTQQLTGFNGGTLPDRKCNQVGQWQGTNNNCQRVVCDAINPPIPTSSSDTEAWAAWENAGGATYPSANGSRSEIRIQAESISYGTCNEDLGFFQMPGGIAPNRSCDHNGNWLPVQNGCVTRCEGITDETMAKNINNGNSYWSEILDIPIGGEKDGEFLGCVAGYVSNPYPPIKDKYGNNLDEAIANDLSRAAENPQRVCKSITTAGGVANVWTTTSSACTNVCPGANTDPRIGVGKTVHSSAIHGNLTIDWADTNLGSYQYFSNCNGVDGTGVAASDFTKDRTNGCYVLKRHCNINGKWDEPEPMCVGAAGQIGFANYTIPGGTTGLDNSTPAGSSTFANGVCINNYWPTNRGEDPAPKRSCVYKPGSNNIDEVFWKLNDDSNECILTTCLPPENNILISADGRAEIRITKEYSVTDGTLDGICRGPTINSSGSSEVVDQAGYNLFGDIPNAVCQLDGNWSAVKNSTNCKKSCLPPINTDWKKVDAHQCGGGINYRAFGMTSQFDGGGNYLRHGQILSFNATDHCGDGGDSCNYWRYAIRCNDGILDQKSLEHRINEESHTTVNQWACEEGQYFDWDSNTWKIASNSESSLRNNSLFISEQTQVSGRLCSAEEISHYTSIHGNIHDHDKCKVFSYTGQDGGSYGFMVNGDNQ